MRPFAFDPSIPDSADRRQAIAEILARGLVRLLAPKPTTSLSAGRSLPNLLESHVYELALQPQTSVTVHAG